MYSQGYESDSPLPLIATNYIVVKADEAETKKDEGEKIILEIGKPEQRAREEQTFSHKKYDKTISHHRSYVLNDYEEPTRRTVFYRPQEGEDRHEVQRYTNIYEPDFRESSYQEAANSESSLEYPQSDGHEQSSNKLVICDNDQDAVLSWKERALQLEKGMATIVDFFLIIHVN